MRFLGREFWFWTAVSLLGALLIAVPVGILFGDIAGHRAIDCICSFFAGVQIARCWRD